MDEARTIGKSQSRYGEASLPTAFGVFRCIVYRAEDMTEHVALVRGDVSKAQPVFCRIQSECLTGEVFGSQKCDCKSQLDSSMKAIDEAGEGVLIYLRQEGRGIGLGNKIKAYALQESGLDTVDANRALGFPDDLREFRIAASILKDLGVYSIKLMTNNPQKVKELENSGITIVERVALYTPVSNLARQYLEVKKSRMGHLIVDGEKGPPSIEVDH